MRVDIDEMKAFLKWRQKNDAIDATTACKILGIKRPTLTIWLNHEKIKGHRWGGAWWFPSEEVKKKVNSPMAGRVGRPRSGDTANSSAISKSK